MTVPELRALRQRLLVTVPNGDRHRAVSLSHEQLAMVREIVADRLAQAFAEQNHEQSAGRQAEVTVSTVG